MLILAAALAVQAPGPSFACEQAATAQEKLVCSRRTLAKADLELDSAYRRALAPLSPAGRRQLALSQRAWLSFRTAVCPFVRRPPPDGQSTEACLEARYEERKNQLNEAVRQVGPFRIVRLDGYRVWPQPVHSVVEFDGVTTNEERFDWIDVDAAPPPLRAAAREWNAGLDRRPTTTGARWLLYSRPRTENDVGAEYGWGADSGRDLEILAASPDAIVTRETNYWMGSWHPEEEMSYETRLIRERRAMRFGDLLTRRADWGRFAKKRVLSVPPMNSVKDWPRLAETAADPGSLVPGAAGLTVNFGRPLGRPSGEATIELSWKEVEPFLSPSGRRLAAGFARYKR
ncbi:MAG TPA: lysozyme inhibitor LprI family protein [Allosphingosinicella sp.]|jgi:uncharacterized protein YecT (DUF1311 family)